MKKICKTFVISLLSIIMLSAFILGCSLNESNESAPGDDLKPLGDSRAALPPGYISIYDLQVEDVSMGGLTIWALGGNENDDGYSVYRWSFSVNAWQLIMGRYGIRISVRWDGNAVICDNQRNIYQYTGGSNWVPIYGKSATDVACGDGDLFVVGTDSNVWKWQQGTSWTNWGGGGNVYRIDYDDNVVWAINYQLDVVKTYYPNAWQYHSGQPWYISFTDIGCGGMENRVVALGEYVYDDVYRGVYDIQMNKIKWFYGSYESSIDIGDLYDGISYPSYTSCGREINGLTIFNTPW